MSYNQCELIRRVITQLLWGTWYIIARFFKNPTIYGTKKSIERPKRLTPHEERIIINELNLREKSTMMIEYLV